MMSKQSAFENNQRKSRGGSRKGSGRKKGSVTIKTREIAEKAAREGKTPLEVMLEAMKSVYDGQGAEAAFHYAKDVAPYMHAKISSVELSGSDGGSIDVAVKILEARKRVGIS